MICMTGGERTAGELAIRLTEHAALPRQEVRLDLLERIDSDALALVRSSRVIATCRGAGEGGGFTGSRREQFEVLRRALTEQPGFIDVDAGLPRELRRELIAGRGGTQVILSWHGTQPGQRPPADMTEDGAQLLKVAVPVDDAADLAGLLDVFAGEQRPVIRIGMGAAGRLSRALYSRFGSPWTYVIPDAAIPTAPGQLTLTRALQWRIDEAAGFVPLALVGGEAVDRSPGPRVYNHLFTKLGMGFIYLPVATARPAELLGLLERLGFGGCSVTMPAKEIVVSQLDELCAPADRVGAVNTVVFRAGRRIGFNTDVDAVADLVGKAAGGAALVLGSGGAARAAVVALKQLGCAVSVSARNGGRAAELAADLGAKAVPWEQRGQSDFRVLVNATPAGTDGVGSPLPDCTGWDGRLVVDAVIADRLTPLLQQALRGGARAVPGTAWWLAQGARQLELLVGICFARAALEQSRG